MCFLYIRELDSVDKAFGDNMTKEFNKSRDLLFPLVKNHYGYYHGITYNVLIPNRITHLPRGFSDNNKMDNKSTYFSYLIPLSFKHNSNQFHQLCCVYFLNNNNNGLNKEKSICRSLFASLTSLEICHSTC